MTLIACGVVCEKYFQKMKYQFFLIFVAYLCNLSEAHTLNKLRRKPPTAKYRLNKLYLKHQDEIGRKLNKIYLFVCFVNLKKKKNLLLRLNRG